MFRKGDLGQAEVGDGARAPSHEDVQALQVSVRHLPRESGHVTRERSRDPGERTPLQPLSDN